jgi:Secretion system C-terminal sorting domain
LTKPVKEIILSNVKPNPFTESINLNIVLQQSHLPTIQMIDMAGRVVLTRDVQGTKGTNEIRYNKLADLSEGIYFIKIITPDAVLQQKKF